MSRLISKVKRFVSDPAIRFSYMSKLGFYNKMDDEKYLKRKYKSVFGKSLQLSPPPPQTFNEKLQWLKLYDRKPEYTVMVDKYLVKQYVAEKIGEEYIIPTLGVWDNAKDIDFDKLPNQFVLKCNHNSGTGMYICKDKSRLTLSDIKKIRKDLQKGLKQDYYLTGREWPYKNVPRKIIAEKFLEDEKTGELRDYKFFCFNGEPKALFIATDRQSKNKTTCFDFFDIEFNHLPILNGHPNAEILPQKPSKYEEMILLAKKLSKDIPHIRVDFYECNGKVYFGELTLYQNSGFVPFEPYEWDKTFGDWIVLPEK